MQNDPPYVDIHTHRPAGRGIELRTAGVHPWEAGRQPVESLLPLDPGVQAIGETGLDFACDVPHAAQYAAFRAQLGLARRCGLPVVLHCVRAFNEVLRELKACPPRAAIFHGFVGSPEQARQAVRDGWHLAFGMRSFRSPRSVEAMRTTPLSRLFFETDDGTEPIEAVYAGAAERLGVPETVLRQAAWENYNRIFTEA